MFTQRKPGITLVMSDFLIVSKFLQTIDNDFVPYKMPSLPEKNKRQAAIENLRKEFLDFERGVGVEYYIHKRNKYCSLFREAMISFVELFADIYGVGIEFILTEGKKIAEILKGYKILDLFGMNDI